MTVCKGGWPEARKKLGSSAAGAGRALPLVALPFRVPGARLAGVPTSTATCAASPGQPEGPKFPSRVCVGGWVRCGKGQGRATGATTAPSPGRGWDPLAGSPDPRPRPSSPPAGPAPPRAPTPRLPGRAVGAGRPLGSPHPLGSGRGRAPSPGRRKEEGGARQSRRRRPRKRSRAARGELRPAGGRPRPASPSCVPVSAARDAGPRRGSLLPRWAAAEGLGRCEARCRLAERTGRGGRLRLGPRGGPGDRGAGGPGVQQGRGLRALPGGAADPRPPPLLPAARRRGRGSARPGRRRGLRARSLRGPRPGFEVAGCCAERAPPVRVQPCRVKPLWSRPRPWISVGVGSWQLEVPRAAPARRDHGRLSGQVRAQNLECAQQCVGQLEIWGSRPYFFCQERPM
jgi:hypothetical protein